MGSGGAHSDRRARSQTRIYSLHSGPFHPRAKVESGVLAAECSELVTNFFPLAPSIIPEYESEYMA